MNVLTRLYQGGGCALVLLVLLAGCMGESDTARIGRLESEFREVFTKSTTGFDSPEIQKKALQLTEAYETYANSHPEDTLAARYLSHAADLYEHTLGDLNKTISALDRIMDRYPGTALAEQALFRKAYIFHNVMRDLPRAKTLYETFLAKYPNSPLAESARFELNNLGVPESKLLDNLPVPLDTPKESSF